MSEINIQSEWHPDMARVTRLINATDLRPADPTAQPLQEARAAAHDYWGYWNRSTANIPGIVNTTLKGAAKSFRVRLLHPAPGHKRGVIVYCHGGGYALNSLDTHDRIMRTLASKSGLAVLGIEYSLAPEYRFPIQIHEVIAALDWLKKEADFLSVIPERFALCGDSSGAHLALATALHLRNLEVANQPSVLALAYGMYDPGLNTKSHRLFGDGRYGLTTERMRWYWNAMWPEGDCDPALVAPLTADLSGLPDTILVIAELDCLRDDSRLLHRALEHDDVAVQAISVPGVPHSFLQYAPILEPAERILVQMAQYFSQKVNGETVASHLATTPDKTAELRGL